MVGLCLVYFGFCKKLLLIMCLFFYLIIGEWIYGCIGYVVDLFVVFGMVFGVVILFGFGVN